MRYVVLPQAVRRVIPPLLNDFIGLQKDTALISVIGVSEAVQQAQNYARNYYNFTGYVVAAVFFVALTIPLARFTDHIDPRARAPRAGAAAVSADGAFVEVDGVYEALRRQRGAPRHRLSVSPSTRWSA